jgi:2-iminobutanoate/2-iminopropanoate deaminase
LYTSGQIAMEPRTGNIPPQMAKDAAAQTVKCLRNLDAILTEGGVTSKDVTKVTVFVQDLKDFATVNTKCVQGWVRVVVVDAC